MTSLNETVEKYVLVRDKVKELQKKLEKYKLAIEKSLTADGLKKLKLQKYVITKRQVKSERLNKTDCPKDVWEKYHKVSVYSSLEIEEVKSEKNPPKKDEKKARKSV